tara:strand:+ start:113 stop:1018 length:906 start_codon:yes stop_codon:yes gene_type:complete
MTTTVPSIRSFLVVPITPTTLDSPLLFLLLSVLLKQTNSNGTDQSYLPTLHLSLPELIGDRTDFLLWNAQHDTSTSTSTSHPDDPTGSTTRTTSDTVETVDYAIDDIHVDNPGEAAGVIIRAAEAAAALLVPGGRFECIVPCNTFHAPSIFNACVASSGGVTPIHMVRETVQHIRGMFPNVTTVGVMCTTGTRSLRLYHDLLEKDGYQVCEVSEQEQNELHRTIYDPHKGIKALGKTTWSTTRFKNYAQTCIGHGAEVIILGCTEIPIVLNTCAVPLVDPLICGARALIRKTYPTKLKMKE